MAKPLDSRSQTGSKSKGGTGSGEWPKSAKDADAEVLRLLEAMRRAVTAGDERAIAAMWETPALVLGDSMARAVSSLDELETLFSGVKEQYTARGISDTRPEIMRLDWLTERLAVVSVRWPYLDEQGNERGYETSTYTLRRNDDGVLKLHVAVMHGAIDGRG